MKYLKDYSDYLISRGYKQSEVCDFLDNCLTQIYFHKNGKQVGIQVYVDKETMDLACIGVAGIFIESTICNIRNFFDGSAGGISLVDNPSNYSPHSLDLFEKCIDIQENVAKHEIFIMQKHIDNLKWLQENLHQFLINHDYVLDYSSTFDIQERDTSDFRIDYHHPNELSSVMFTLTTDCITGDFIFHTKKGKRVKIREIENLCEFIRESEWCINGELSEEFKYFEDKNWTIDSYKEVLKFYQDYQHKNWGNVYNLPPEYNALYQEYLEHGESTK